MATFDSRDLVDQIIKHNGWTAPPVSYSGVPYDQDDPGTWEPDNLPVVKIVQYTNGWGNTAWGCVFYGEKDQDKYERPTSFVQRPSVVWRREGRTR